MRWRQFYLHFTDKEAGKGKSSKLPKERSTDVVSGHACFQPRQCLALMSGPDI